jgi:hypothetical protein
MNLVLGIILGVIAQILTFTQLQGQFKFQWMKENYFLTSLIGVPISLLFIKSVGFFVTYFNGEKWPSRLLGFAIGAIVFTIMSWIWFKEPLTLKTGVCLFLAFCIMMIQLFWK